MRLLSRYAAAAALLAILSVAFIRAAVSGSEDLETARECEKAGLTGTAIDFYERAARWYTPFTTTSSDAIEGLLDIARGSVERKDPGTARKALYGARNAILSTRWLFTPDSDRLDEVNRSIARLEAADAEPGSHGSDEAANLALLRRTDAPNPLVSLFSTLTFLAWIIVTLVGATRVVTPDGRFAGMPAIKWISLSAALLFGWLILLAFA